MHPLQKEMCRRNEGVLNLGAERRVMCEHMLSRNIGSDKMTGRQERACDVHVRYSVIGQLRCPDCV